MTKRTWEDNAAEFGALSKQGVDVRLAVLVACSIEEGRGEGGDPDRTDRYGGDGKTSARAFTKLALGITNPQRVLRHLAAWEKCAKKGYCEPSMNLAPDDVNTTRFPTQEQFTEDFDASKSGGRPRASMDEIVDRAKTDSAYAEELITALAETNVNLARKVVDKVMDDVIDTTIVMAGGNPHRDLDDGDYTLEAASICMVLMNAATRIRRLRDKIGEDHWHEYEGILKDGFKHLDHATARINVPDYIPED